MRITIRDIARNLNLSHSTVSKVLNRRTDAFISEATRRRVEEEATRLCYRPNQAARALASGKTNLIGLCVGDFNTYNISVINHVEDHLRRRGLQMVVQRIVNLERGGRILEWPLDGMLILDFPDHIAMIREATQNQIPIVSMGSYSAELVDHVSLDLFSGAVEAMERLIEQKYTRIIYVTSEWGSRVGEARHDAYFRSVEKAGLVPEAFIVDGPTREAAYDMFARNAVVGRLRDEQAIAPKKTTLFCFNDEIALGVYRALMEGGIRVPEDIALVGCDDSRDIQYLECPLSTISYSVSDLCEAGVNLLEKRIQNPGSGLQRAVVASQFIERKSSADG